MSSSNEVLFMQPGVLPGVVLRYQFDATDTFPPAGSFNAPEHG